LRSRKGECDGQSRDGNSTIAKSKRQIVSSIEDGPSEYDREKYHTHLIEQYKLYVEMVDRPDTDLPPRPARRCDVHPFD